MSSAYKNYSTNTTTRQSKAVTPQTKPIPGRETEMVKNNAGGYTFQVTPMDQLSRFLILGSESNTCHVDKKTLTANNAKNVIKLFGSENGVQAVELLETISNDGRAHKNEPAIFALALAMTHGTPETKNRAYEAIRKVARTGTDMFHLAGYVNDMRGWGRGVRRGFSKWYNDRSAMSLARQITKYAQRDGWTHLDVLRLAHVKPATETHDALFAHVKGVAKPADIDLDVANYISAVEEVAKCQNNPKRAIQLITEFELPREVLPTELLNDKNVWAALLPHMGTTALIRNLGKMTSIGLIGQTGEYKKIVMEKLTNQEKLIADRIHPLTAIQAQRQYMTGHGDKGGLTWSPVAGVTSALEDTFYKSFKAVRPTGKARGIFLDTSGSMSASSTVNGLTCRDVAAVMSMVTVRVEEDTVVRGFSSGSRSYSNRATVLEDLGITKNDSLSEVVKKVERANWGGTDCSLPMTWATENGIELDSFEIITDSDTWAGDIQPVQALRDYRKTFNRDARMVVAATLASPFTIADPTDAGQLDVVGFDSASPQIIADFVAGRI